MIKDPCTLGELNKQAIATVSDRLEKFEDCMRDKLDKIFTKLDNLADRPSRRQSTTVTVLSCLVIALATFFLTRAFSG